MEKLTSLLRLIFEELRNMFASKKETSRKIPFNKVMAILNTILCHLASPTSLLFFSI